MITARSAGAAAAAATVAQPAADAQRAGAPNPKQAVASKARRVRFRTLRALWVVCAIIGVRALFATDYALAGGFLDVSLAGTAFQERKLLTGRR